MDKIQRLQRLSRWVNYALIVSWGMFFVFLMLWLVSRNTANQDPASCKDAKLGFMSTQCPNVAHTLQPEDGVAMCRCLPKH